MPPTMREVGEPGRDGRCGTARVPHWAPARSPAPGPGTPGNLGKPPERAARGGGGALASTSRLAALAWRPRRCAAAGVACAGEALAAESAAAATRAATVAASGASGLRIAAYLRPLRHLDGAAKQPGVNRSGRDVASRDRRGARGTAVA